MKRVFLLIMVCALLAVAVPSLADDHDPIVGSWYINGVIEDGYMASQFGDMIRFVCLLTFEDDGTITYYEADYNSSSITSNAAQPSPMGQWARSGDDYTVSFFGVGENPAYIRGNVLYMIMLVPNVYYVLHRMTPMNWYLEMIPSTTINLFLQ